MGSPVARLADLCTGHQCWPPRPNVEGSENVFVNSRPHHRLGDAWAVHCCVSCHSSVTCTGSTSVFVNSIPAARVGDMVCCTSAIMTGSFNVFERTAKMKEIVNFSDINLDFIPHPLTGNVGAKTNIDSIRQAIKILFLLNPFDVPFNQSSFTNIKYYLFENINHLTISNIIKRIEWSIKTYEKRVTFISANVVPYDSDDGFEVTVTYKINAINLEDTFSQQFQRVR